MEYQKLEPALVAGLQGIPQNLKAMLDTESLIFGAVKGDHLLGIIVFSLSRGTQLIHYLYVQPSMRRRGIGSRLLQIAGLYAASYDGFLGISYESAMVEDVIALNNCLAKNGFYVSDSANRLVHMEPEKVAKNKAIQKICSVKLHLSVITPFDVDSLTDLRPELKENPMIQEYILGGHKDRYQFSRLLYNEKSSSYALIACTYEDQIVYIDELDGNNKMDVISAIAVMCQTILQTNAPIRQVRFVLTNAEINNTFDNLIDGNLLGIKFERMYTAYKI